MDKVVINTFLTNSEMMINKKLKKAIKDYGFNSKEHKSLLNFINTESEENISLYISYKNLSKLRVKQLKIINTRENTIANQNILQVINSMCSMFTKDINLINQKRANRNDLKRQLDIKL